MRISKNWKSFKRRFPTVNKALQGFHKVISSPRFQAVRRLSKYGKKVIAASAKAGLVLFSVGEILFYLYFNIIHCEVSCHKRILGIY